MVPQMEKQQIKSGKLSILPVEEDMPTRTLVLPDNLQPYTLENTV